MMQAEGYRRFKMQQHTDLWKAENARDRGTEGSPGGASGGERDPKLGFGSPVFGKEGWGWNEKWVTRVRTYCEERYGKRENSRAQSEAGEPSQHLAKMPPEGNDERP